MKKREPVFNRKKPEVKNSVESPDEQEAAESVSSYGVVANASFVSVHDRPSDTSKVVDYLMAGDKVKILEYKSGFYKVQFGQTGLLGFIDHNFIRGDDYGSDRD